MNAPAGPIRNETLRIAGERVGDRARASKCAIRTPAKSSGRCRRRRSTTCGGRSRDRPRLRAELTRYERYRILMKAGEIIAGRRDEIADLITPESRAVQEGLDLRSRPRLRRVRCSPPTQALVDDGQVFSCDLTPHGKSAQGLHAARAAAGRDLRHHAVQSSAEPGRPQGRAVDRHQQPDGAEADREDAAVRASCWPTCCTRPGCRRRCCRSSPATRARSPTRC